MFFLLNALPQGLQLGPWQLAMTPWLAVTLSLAVYASAYVCDNGGRGDCSNGARARGWRRRCCRWA